MTSIPKEQAAVEAQRLADALDNCHANDGLRQAAAMLRALASTTAVSAEPVAWLVESTTGCGWWDGRFSASRGIDPRFFTHDPNEAVRFARKEDAEKVAKQSSFTIATEHVWISRVDATRPATASVPTPPAEPSKVDGVWSARRWLLSLMGEHDFTVPNAAFEALIKAIATHPKAEPAGVAESLDTLSLYKRLCDLVAEANAVGTVIGRPDVLLAKLTKLRDEVGAMTDTRLPASPAAPQDKEADRG